MKIKMTLSILLLAMVSVLPAFAIEPVSKCDALAAWAAGLEKLPADYESFSALEPGQRSAVYKRLSYQQRAGLWQEQLSRQLAQDGFSEAQRALIAESRAFATAENLAAKEAGAGSAFDAAEAAFDRLEARVNAAFSREEVKRLFHVLGPDAARGIKSSLSDRCDCTEDYLAACGPIGDEFCAIGNCFDPGWCGYMWREQCTGGCTSCVFGGC